MFFQNAAAPGRFGHAPKIFLNRQGMGPGVFEDVPFDLGAVPGAGVTATLEMIVRDLDGNGLLDSACLDQGLEAVIFFQDDVELFHAARPGTGEKYLYVDAGDLDDDGDLDLIGAARPGGGTTCGGGPCLSAFDLLVLEQTGTEEFREADLAIACTPVLASGAGRSGCNPHIDDIQALFVTDLDGDGEIDVVQANTGGGSHTVNVFFNAH